MHTLKKTRLLIVTVAMLLTAANAHAWEPSDKDLDSAISAGDFGGYLANLSAWLNQQVPTQPDRISEAALSTLLKNPILAKALDQRQLISKYGVDNLNAFARSDAKAKAFLAWLLRDSGIMDLYLEAAVPLRIADRESNKYTLPKDSLPIWNRIYNADPDSRQGLYLKLAIATALRPPGTGNRGAGMAATPADPVDRYKHFKTAHQNKELFPSFDNLTVWEYEHVVSSCASDVDLAWARQMLDTWRPDLRKNEQVVNSTSEVWYRTPLHPFTDYKSVISAGGKCGPRSSWSVMICQAFGIPAIGVGQPGHACVAYKVYDPSLPPQPGSAWKVGYGRGWQVSRLEGMSGIDFVAGVEQRSHAAQFSQVEHLRWLASVLSSPEQSAAVMAVAHTIQQSAPAVKTDITASAKAAEAEKEVQPEKATKALAAATKEPLKLSPDTTLIEAAAFSAMSGVRVYNCYTGGKQVNFQKNMQNSWIDYTLDVPAAGTYQLQIRLATPNLDQVLEVSSGANKLATIQVPNTTGLWAMTPAVDIPLEKGKQTLRISAPYQRGVAVRSVELHSKK